MSNFHEFTVLWRKEKSKEEVELEKKIHGEDVDIYLPGYDKGRITINLDAIIAFNETNSPWDEEYVHTTVELQAGERYRIDMKYDDFKAVIVYHLKTKIKP